MTTQSIASPMGGRFLNAGAGQDETALGGDCEGTAVAETATTPAGGGTILLKTCFAFECVVTCAALGSTTLFGTTSCRSAAGVCDLVAGVLGRVAGMPARGVDDRGAALGREGLSTDSVEALGREGVLARGAVGVLLFLPAVT